MLTEDQISRLPKGVQLEIRALLNRLEAAEREVANLLGEEKTSIEINAYRDMMRDGAKKTYVPDHARIVFTLIGGDVTVGMRDGMLEFQADSVGEFDMTLRPRASNSGWISFDRAYHLRPLPSRE